MAKENKKVKEITALEGEGGAPVEKKVRKAPEPKELPDELLYLPEDGGKFTESTTVFGAMRQFVADNGGKALRSEILAHMVANFKPKKSNMEITAFVKSYLRDVVKLRFLSNKDYGVTTLPTKPVREKKETTKDANGLSEMGKTLLKALAGELTAGEVQNGTSSVTIVGLAAQIDKNAQTVRMSMKSLVKNEFAAYIGEGETQTVVLTQKGWDLAQQA